MDVTVVDQHGLEDKIDVKVMVTNVNEEPSITRTTGDDALFLPGEYCRSHHGAPSLHRHRRRPVGDSITWSVEGTGNDNFSHGRQRQPEVRETHPTTRRRPATP